MINLEAIKERLAAVPAPPWGEFCESGDWWIGPQDEDGGPRDEASICNSSADDMTQEVADFIAAAPQDITDLLAEIDRLTKERDAWERRARELEGQRRVGALLERFNP